MGPILWSPPRIGLRAILFSVYSLPLGRIINAQHSGTKYNFWADDGQLCLIFEPLEAGSATDNMASLIKDICQWLIANCMCKNDNKTEISILCSMLRTPPILHHFRVGDDFISASTSVTNLEVFFIVI